MILSKSSFFDIPTQLQEESSFQASYWSSQTEILQQGWECSSVVEHLPSMYKAKGLAPKIEERERKIKILQQPPSRNSQSICVLGMGWGQSALSKGVWWEKSWHCEQSWRKSRNHQETERTKSLLGRGSNDLREYSQCEHAYSST